MSLAPIDIATLALCRGLIQLLLSGLLLFAIRYDRNGSGPGFWAIGFALNGLALTTFVLHHPEQKPLLNIINHLATGLGSCTLLFGFWRFNKQTPSWPILGLIGSLPIIGLLFGGDLERDSITRVLITATSQLMFYLNLLHLLGKPYRQEVGLLFRWLQGLIVVYLPIFFWQYSLMCISWLGHEHRGPYELYRASFGIAALLFTVTLAVACIALQLVRISAHNADSAVTDWLTGMLNRRGLSLLAAQDDARRERDRGISAVICLDIDHFKQVNDRLGHAAGDKVLKMLGEVIRANIRGQDIGARQGGEEFGVVLVGSDETQAVQVAERIRHQFSNRSLNLGLALQDPITLSAGVVGIANDRTVLQGLDAADVALYAAKRAGRNRVMSASSLSDAGGR
ncbi:GGDEF domain-containing protein [Chitinimonas sp. PSY-7]|uniref:diguanylate cyclase n=1 Tax=Chitinimonas sp. PSY-7 TaxID=3459088 RepID=UPI0040401EE1